MIHHTCAPARDRPVRAPQQRINHKPIRTIRTTSSSSERGHPVRLSAKREQTLPQKIAQSETSIKAVQTSIHHDKTPIKVAQTSIKVVQTSIHRDKTSIKVAQTSIQSVKTSIHPDKTPIKAAQTSIQPVKTLIHRNKSPIQSAKTSIQGVKDSILGVRD